MPTLDWIGIKAVGNHHKEVPFHLLAINLFGTRPAHFSKSQVFFISDNPTSSTCISCRCNVESYIVIFTQMYGCKKLQPEEEV